MPTTDPTASAAPARPPFLAALGPRSIVIALGMGVGVALLLDPIFAVPFAVVLGRTLLLALLLLLVYAAARQWTPRRLPAWLPTWAWPVVAVTLAALPGTLLIYLASLKGDVTALVHPARIWGILWIAGSGMVLGLLLAASAGVRERLAEARSHELQFELERARLEKQAVDARLALLQAQIEPHFLFNTLANVQALVEAGSPRAAELLKSLIAYLRAALPRLHEGPATLGQELALVRAYLELMRMRMPDRLRFSIDADEDLLQRPLPPMALLTLVENAVRHGVDPLEQGGEIAVRAQRQAAGWELSVSDDGAGIDPHGQPGTGLANLRERLTGFFSGAATLQLEERQPRGVCARIVITDGGGVR
ncbi:MAG: histidine kinase [Rubrivivax sp.]